MSEQKSVLVVEDEDLNAQMFEAIIEASGRYRLSGKVKNALLAPVYCHRGIDLVLMDVWTELGESGLEAAAVIKREFPHVKVIIVTSMPEVSYIARARESGVESFWYKNGSQEKLVDVMDRTMAGEQVYPDKAPVQQIGQIKSHDLTARELDVLREVVRGDTNQEIAERLFLSVETVKSHIKEMMSKTGFHTRTELAVRARESGIVVPEKKEPGSASCGTVKAKSK